MRPSAKIVVLGLFRRSPSRRPLNFPAPAAASPRCLFFSQVGMHDLAENMNRRHRAAQLAGRASVQLHTQLYFRDHPAAGEPAYVLGVHPDKVVVLVPRFGVEGTIWLGAEAEAGRVDFDPETHTLTLLPEGGAAAGAGGGSTEVVRVKVFDAVCVHVSVVVRSAKGADDGTGRPTVRVLLTSPPIGEQPEEECTAAEQAGVDAAASSAAPASAEKRKAGPRGGKEKAAKKRG